MPWSVYNSNGKLLQSLAIGDDSIVEGKLDVSNAPTNGQFLQAQSGEGGGLTWAAVSAGPSQAVQSDIEAETNQDTYIPPDLLHFAPSAAKAWCAVDNLGSFVILNSYNCVPSDAEVGGVLVTFGTDFSSANYAVAVANKENAYTQVGNPAAGNQSLYTKNLSETKIDTNFVSAAWFGDQ